MKVIKGPRIVKKKAIDTAKDPYLNKTPPADGAVCRKCGAVHIDKRWTISIKARMLAILPRRSWV